MPSRASTSSSNGSADVLSPCALNRALLARQLLLERAALPPADAIEHLVGLQAQKPLDPYYAFWSRLAGFQPDELGQMVAERAAVRIVVMRGTIHLLTARDCLVIRPVVQPTLTTLFRSGSPYGRALAGMDIDAVVAAGRELLDEAPRSLTDLRTLLGARWPERHAASLAYAVHYLLPLVQLPPHGVWGKAGRPICALTDTWLGAPLTEETEDVIETTVEVLAIVAKAEAESWLSQFGNPN